MAQNITDHLQVGSGVDLSTGVTVAERVSPNPPRDPSLTCVLLDAMTDGCPREWIVWNFRRQEYPS